MPFLFACLLCRLSLAATALAPERAAEILALKNRGLAELEEGRSKQAEASFSRLAGLVPAEPLPLADGAVAALRSGDFGGAEKLLGRAIAISGERSDLFSIAAAIASARNDSARTRAMLAKAAALSPRDLESRWRFVRSAEAETSARESVAEREKYLAEIVHASPSNVPALMKLLLVRLEAGKVAAAAETEGRVEEVLAPIEPRVEKFFAEGKALLRSGAAAGASLKFRIAENLLRVTDRYRQSLSELFTDVAGLPLEAFSPAFEESLRPRAGAPISVSFAEAGGVSAELAPRSLGRRVDLQNRGTAAPYAVAAPWKEAAFIDFDSDGDLDAYLYASGGPDRLSRNNLDGTWSDVTGSTGDARFSSSRVVVSDVDRDGDLDLVCVTEHGSAVVRSNLRQGRFQTIRLGVEGSVDVAAADLNADGAPEVVVATRTGIVLLVNDGSGGFKRATGGDLAKMPAGFVPRRVAVADLDNDGFPDIVGGGETGLAFYRNSGFGTFTYWPIAPRGVGRVDEIAAVDFDGDGDLDLSIDEAGKSRFLENRGGNANNWLDVSLEGLATGSGKVNRAGVGSQVEVKAGSLYGAQTVGLQPTHFGLGKRARADVVRCVWTNGIPQNLFDQKARALVREVQQLKGSCPFVYARNGTTGKWSFVSDALGRAPIGLLYDGVHLAGADPREWLKIPEGMLAPDASGRLALDYTEELWEAAFLDMARLIAVDHPRGTDVVPNERTVPGILEKKLFTVARPRALRAASADGKDATALLAKADRRYVEPGKETAYQGVRTEHELVLDVGPIAPSDRVVLYLTGWIFYTDVSINVSLSQRGDFRPSPPLLEVPDGSGAWKIAIPSLGFPAGKTKTMPVDLTGLLDPKDPRVRIRTTMEIYWDQIFTTVNDPAVPIRTTELAPESAKLSYRGFSRRYRETKDGPEIFDHDDVDLSPHWADVSGRLTRFGDVSALLQKADDRWVAFEGGDAIRIEFDARPLPPLPEGLVRDYILVSDGWDKDFDKNTVTGTTVAPYPFHAMSAYPYPETEAFPDPTFLEEWVTRPVSPEKFYAWVRDYGGEAIR